jgi:small-conductance mechanosensitive channel
LNIQEINELIQQLPSLDKRIFYQKKLKNTTREEEEEEPTRTREEEKKKEKYQQEEEVEQEEYSTLSSIAEELKLKSKRMNETIKEDDFYLDSVQELSNQSIKQLSQDHEELKKYETTLKQVNSYYLFLFMILLFLFMYGIIKVFPK